MKIKLIEKKDAYKWDEFVYNHPKATVYHLSGWENVIRKTYCHKTYYLMAIEDNHAVAGILPLVHLRHFIFGNSLISIPFFDLGGVLANNQETEKALLTEAIRLGKKLKADAIELRHTEPLSALTSNTPKLIPNSQFLIPNFAARSHKVRMLLDLPEHSEILMTSFKAKLRSQIKKPIKEGLRAKIGGIELLNDFYKVFLINMRDLGSPVHSKNLMKNVLEEFPNLAKIVIVYKGKQPLSVSLIIGFREILENPWASSLREYSKLSPNMLLYWTMLEYACNNGFTCFDFGRSSPDEGTYKFKEQWGAKPAPLHWHYISLNNKMIETGSSEKSKFDKAIQYWKRLPVSVTQIIGPMIRKHIGL